MAYRIPLACLSQVISLLICSIVHTQGFSDEVHEYIAKNTAAEPLISQSLGRSFRFTENACGPFSIFILLKMLDVPISPGEMVKICRKYAGKGELPPKNRTTP